MSRPLALAAISSAVLSTLLACTLLACGGPPDSATPENATPDGGATGAPAASTAPPIDVAAEGPAPEGKTVAPAANAGPSEGKLRASKALDPSATPFPDIDLVSKEIGPPSTSGKAQRRQWRYGTKPLGKTFSCETIDLLSLIHI